MHCKGHQRGQEEVARGNRAADREARLSATRDNQTYPDMTAYLAIEMTKELNPRYSKAEELQATVDLKGYKRGEWFVLPDGRIFVPENLAWPVVKDTHSMTHMGKSALAEALQCIVYINRLHSLCVHAAERCTTCAQVNPKQGPTLPPGSQPMGYYPMDSLVIDFTDMPRCGLYKAMLVLVCNYTWWPECFPMKTKQAREVTRILLKDIIPRYGVPSFISSDNGPEFVHQVNQKLAKSLGTHWRFHCAFGPNLLERLKE